MISLDNTQGINTIKYVKEGSHESVLSDYRQRIKEDERRKSWVVEHTNRNNAVEEIRREHLNDNIQTTKATNIDEDIPI